jgi:histidinol phosphatase-like PHP family hydrolase
MKIYNINPANTTYKQNFLGKSQIVSVQTAPNPNNISSQTDNAASNKHFAAKATGTLLGIGLMGAAIYCINVAKGKPATIQNEYTQMLADGVGKLLKAKIKPENLSCVATKDELLEILPKLKECNYQYNNENLENGIFKADLHSHSNFSDGTGEVEDLLNQAAEYGNELYEKTNEKFIFALTDHDGVDGVKKALCYIAKDPEKFKNIKFVPGSELSFAHAANKTGNPTETDEVLAYCINPFSKPVEDFFENIHSKRRNVITDTIDKFSEMFPDTKFSKEEFSKVYNTDLTKDVYAANIHWRVFHYGQTKLAISKIAKENNENPENLYETVMSKTKKDKALGNLRDFVLVPPNTQENQEITNLRLKTQPRVNSDGSITASSENTIDGIFDTFANEKETVFAFAHPYYISERVTNPSELIHQVVEKSNGKLIGTESFHQAYRNTIEQKAISNINSFCEGEGLIPLGGRDNHTTRLI